MKSDAPLSRRRFIAHSASAVAAGLVVPGLIGGEAHAATSVRQAASPAFSPPVFTAQAQAEALRALGRETLRLPGSRPYPQLAVGTDTMPGVQHIVVLMLENHSFDNFFGMLGRGDGFTLNGKGMPTPELFVANDLIPEALHHTSLDDFFTAAANGTLPSFSFLDPDFSTQSQENLQNIVVGEALLAQVVHALGSSPLWEKSILLVMYDEHGGYYDHVPPPVAIPPDGIPPIVQPGEHAYEGFARYGFRVPSVVVSPYAKPDHLSHVLYDQTSVLAFVERKWNLPALTHRQRPHRLPRPRRARQRPAHVPEAPSPGRPRRHRCPARLLHQGARHDPAGGDH
jgi:phospholipase C